MSGWELLVIALGVSMDAFAVAVGKGMTLTRMHWKSALTTGLWFGAFQALMPLVGYMVGTRFTGYMQFIDHWIALALLGFVGGNMIWQSCNAEEPSAQDASFTPMRMLPLAVATSIDALAIGVTFGFLQVSIGWAVVLIGCITFALSTAGVKIGTLFGVRFAGKATLAGGILLVLMGVKTWLTHMQLLG